jgi:hypothetical protein
VQLAAAQSCLRAVPEAVKFEEAVGRRFEELQALIKVSSEAGMGV